MGLEPLASCETTTVHSSSMDESWQRLPLSRPTFSKMLRRMGIRIMMQVAAERKRFRT